VVVTPNPESRVPAAEPARCGYSWRMICSCCAIIRRPASRLERFSMFSPSCALSRILCRLLRRGRLRYRGSLRSSMGELMSIAAQRDSIQSSIASWFGVQMRNCSVSSRSRIACSRTGSKRCGSVSYSFGRAEAGTRCANGDLGIKAVFLKSEARPTSACWSEYDCMSLPGVGVRLLLRRPGPLTR
jgi:hypothetical protein